MQAKNTSLIGGNFVSCKFSGSLAVRKRQLDYGIFRQENKISNQMFILVMSHQYASYQIELLKQLIVMISLQDYGMLRLGRPDAKIVPSGKKLTDQTVT
ncbi:unnamed protein product [Paramecium sonneborni]|uniref:Uncharacterized protein n=1 Tax=Paramecium sonneborni TaxID=65129 RepID=A0A8S1MPZ3_9CILI|nr:unnamed protein product [Paramecium sonneborni]